MYYFIVNPKSSSGNGRKKWDLVANALKNRNVDYKVYFTRQEGHAVFLSRKICTHHNDITLVAVGGDGTANEVLNGIADTTQITFGYIPTGSSNDLARALKIPSDPLAALEIILNPKQLIDMNIGCLASPDDRMSFAVSCGIGFDAAVCHEALHSRIKPFLNKIKLGKLTYLGIALKQLLLLKPSAMEVILDGNETYHYEDVYFITVMNQIYEGGGFMFCPDAKPDDGYLDICVVEQMSKLRALSLLPTAFHGNHVRAKGVHILRCRQVQIKAPHPLPVHADGELFDYQEELTVQLAKQTLSFIVA